MSWKEVPQAEYAGDIPVRDAWENLQNDSLTILVDVRTEVEWKLVGKPDLCSIQREPLFLQWVTREGPNPNFVTELKAALDERGAVPDTVLMFMCQSGGRSKIAAGQCAALGYSACFNIAEGFDGDLDDQQHRCSINGWRAAGLPWIQS